MAYFDNVNTRFDEPFDQGPEAPTIDAGVDTTGLDYDPRTGSFKRTGAGGGGGGFAGGGKPAGTPPPAATVPPALGVADRAKAWLTDPRNLLSLMALFPALRGLTGGGSGGGMSQDALLDEARQGMALQRQRLEQTQPVFDTLVRMAYGNAPVRHRGEPPAGYQAPSSGYAYTPPRFGGR